VRVDVDVVGGGVAGDDRRRWLREALSEARLVDEDADVPGAYLSAHQGDGHALRDFGFVVVADEREQLSDFGVEIETAARELYGDPVAEVVTQNLGNPPAAWVEGRP